MATPEQILSYFLSHPYLLDSSFSDLAYYMKGEEDMDPSRDPYEENFDIKLFITDHTNNIEEISDQIYNQPKPSFHLYNHIGCTKSNEQIMEILTDNEVIESLTESRSIGDIILELGEIIRKEPGLFFLLVITSDDQPINTNNIIIGLTVYRENIKLLNPVLTLESMKHFQATQEKPIK